jgi:hypothetical protein
MSSTNVEVVATGTYKSNKDRILAELNSIRRKDEKLYRVLKAMVEDLDHVVIQLNPIVEGTSLGSITQELPPTPLTFGYSFEPLSLNLAWTPGDPAGTTFVYELRVGGTGWDDATFVLRTSSRNAALDPQVGAKTYRLKALNINGQESPNSISVAVPAPTITTPSVTASVIDNNVLLYWTEPTSSYNLDHYIITKDGSPIGTTKGTFFTLFESAAGDYTYGVKGVDIAGNEGGLGTVDASVKSPPDFELLTTVNYNESTGTFTNMYYEAYDGKIYGPVDLTETWEQHFNVDQSWASPQAQVTAGYDIFIQENEGPGIWEADEVDLTGGGSLENVIVNVFYTKETLSGTNSPSITVDIKGGDTPGSGTYTSGNSKFFTSIRYVRIKLTVTPDTADSMCALSDIQLTVDVKNAVDGNVRPCLASDTAGTTVSTPGDATQGHGTKSFSDINSITVAPVEDDDMAVTAIYDFTDIPNPTSFKILCFDNAGRRVDANVSWKVRGIEA